MTKITKLYDSSKQATAAVAELKGLGFADIALVSAPPSRLVRPGGGKEAIGTLEQAGVEGAEAADYAERVRRGSVLVAVRAPFGSAARATAVLNRHAGSSPAAVPSASPTTRTPPPAAAAPSRNGRTYSAANGRGPAATAVEPEAKAAPFSNALNIPVLTEPARGRSSDTPTPRSPRTLSALLGIPELIDSNTFFTGIFPLLIGSSRTKR